MGDPYVLVLDVTGRRCEPDSSGGGHAGRIVEERTYHAFAGATVARPPEAAAATAEYGRRLLGEQVRLLEVLAGRSGHVQPTMDLRFLARRDEEKIDILLLAKIPSDRLDSSQQWMRGFWGELHAAWPADYPVTPAIAKDGLCDLLQPFRWTHTADVVRSERLADDVYVVLPMTWHENSFAYLLRALGQSRKPVQVSVRVRPTGLTDEERECIRFLASRLAELADQAYVGFSGMRRSVNIEYGAAAQVYQRMLQELAAPYLMRIQVASEGEVPGALLNALRAELGTSEAARRGEDSGSGAAFVVARPRSRADQMIAMRNLSLLEMDDWVPTLASQEMARLRYLVTPREANCAFRLPLPQAYAHASAR